MEVTYPDHGETLLSTKRAGDGEAEGSRYSTAQKGKGRARPSAIAAPAAAVMPTDDNDHSSPDLSSIDTESDNDTIPQFPLPQYPVPRFNPPPPPKPPIAPVGPLDGGRGKRTKKKRRLSLGEEIDPDTIDDEGNLLPPKPSIPLPKPSISIGVIWDTIQREESNLVEDQSYFSRIEINGRKPLLKNMRAACPAWATSRLALSAGAEYFRIPSKIEGGSVEVGVGGVARGLILEGQSVGGGNYWGTKASAGTIVVSLGKARTRQMGDIRPPVPSTPAVIPQETYLAGPSTPRINVLPSALHIDELGRSSIPIMEDSIEEPEIEALLLAQRARTPVALAVAQDYLEPPFKVPRAFVVLGWFWLTDAWLEPEGLWAHSTSQSTRLKPGDINLVRWKFRFEWCSKGVQGVPWWSPLDEPTRPSTPHIDYKYKIEELDISGPGIKGSSTVIHLNKKKIEDRRTACEKCSHVSEGVYRDAKVCLNELCEQYFMPAAAGGPGLDPISNTPSILRPLQRKTPEFIGLKLRGHYPFASIEEDLPRYQLGGDFWSGWICGKCGMANERRKWSGWDCDGCKHQIYPPRRPISTRQLHNPLHPGIINSGSPRSDIGYPSFPSSYKPTTGYTIYEHHIKIVKHVLEYGDGEVKCEIYHALHARRDHVIDVASRIWRDIQIDGGDDKKGGMNVALKRGMVNTSRRPAERHVSPFYTLACGPDTPLRIDGFPSVLESIPWPNAPMPCLDIMDLINFRAGSMFPGLPEMFNSVVLVVTPPPSVPYPPPTITLQSGEYLSIIILGSEATVSARLIKPTFNDKGEEVGEMGTMIVQHGDVVGFKADKGKMEISIRMEGFGIFCIAQQIYQPIADPGLGAFTITSDRDPIDYKRSTPETSLLALGEIDVNTTVSMGPPPIIKPTVFVPAPLKDWYIGPRPLDITQPLRIRRPTRTRPSSVVGITKSKGRGKGKKNIEVDEPEDIQEKEGEKVNPILAEDLTPTPVDIDIQVDPEIATGYIILDDLPPNLQMDESNPILLEPEIPPSPNLPPTIPGPKKRGSTANDTTPDQGEPKKKRKYVFKNKLVSDIGDGGSTADNTPVKTKPRVSRGKARKSDGNGDNMMDVDTVSSINGTNAEGSIGTGGGGGEGGKESPVKRRGRGPGRPRKSESDAKEVIKPKKAPGKKRKSQVTVDMDLQSEDVSLRQEEDEQMEEDETEGLIDLIAARGEEEMEI